MEILEYRWAELTLAAAEAGWNHVVEPQVEVIVERAAEARENDHERVSAQNLAGSWCSMVFHTTLGYRLCMAMPMSIR